MTSNIPWATQFEGSGGLNPAEGTWNRSTGVNTPQTNPASWPQLGAAPPEQEQLQGAMSPAQLKPQEDTGWGAGPPPISSAPKDPDPNGTGNWGRLPDNANSGTGSTASAGWGVPSGASWGQQMKTSVDDGTAVWSKSSNTQTQGSGWGGGQVTQVKDTGASGWGSTATDTSSSLSVATSSQNSDTAQQAPLQNTPSSSASGSQATNTNPVSWAKAASAGLPSTGDSESPPAESETDQNESSGGATPLPPPAEADPVKQIVNSHEGWGKKPILQETSWIIGGPGPGMQRPLPTVNNGTEAWGKPTGGQMQTPQSWGDAPAPNPASNKPSGGWGGSFTHPQQAQSQNWGVPTQPQPQQQSRPGPASGNAGMPGWGDPQQQTPSVGNARWNEMPGQVPATPTNWGTPLPQQNNAGWGGGQPENNAGSSWGAGPSARPGQPGSGWAGNVMPQPVVDQSWSRPTEPSLARRPSTVDNGTSAWGDPGEYSKVNMWEKSGSGMGTNDTVAQMGANTNSEAQGWGVPPAQTNPVANIPPSPKGWGEMSPTRMSAVDNGTSNWGNKLGGEKWDKAPASTNWNGASKPGMGWGQTNDQQWGQNDGPGGWGPPMGKADPMMKNNMDFAPPRGMMPPQPSMNQQNVMLRNQIPPAVPPQLQNQFQQIRHAVVNGIIPPQVLTPQVMSPQHMHALLQLINKTAECQNIQLQISRITQNKNIPTVTRQQQVEQLSRLLRQCNQQIEAQRGAIIQNVMQKTQGNMSKTNGPLSNMDLGGARNTGGQSMMSPFNNMGALSQALPMSSMTSPNNRMPKTSRFTDNWKPPNSSGGFDNLQQPNFGFNPGPSGDNGLRYNPQLEDMNLMPKSAFSPLDSTGPKSFPVDPGVSNVANAAPASDQTSALVDYGPPEFTPGVPWKGLRQIDPEADPNITPGSWANSKTMSVNTVRDADQVLKRERNALSESSNGAQNSGTGDSLNAASSNAAVSEPTTSAMWSTGVGAANSVSMNSNSRAAQDLWKGHNRMPLSTQAPPFVAKKETSPSWDNSVAWNQNQQVRSPQGTGWDNPAPDTRGSWLVLTNIASHLDVLAVRQVCMQQGNMISFQAQCPIESMALVKYGNPDDAANAQKTLNMQTFGSTMLVASVATDHDVNNFASAAGGGSWGSAPAPGTANRYMSGVGSTGGFMSQPPQQPGMIPGGSMSEPGPLASSVAGQQFWSNAGPNNVPSWPQNTGPSNVAWSGGGAESPMHSLLPENLLGGENM